MSKSDRRHYGVSLVRYERSESERRMQNCTTIGRAVHGIEDHLMMIQKFVKLNLLKSDITKRGVVGGKI